ncbi:MAG: GIY-YIG nuclease family protein [Candidatus Omnitrophica bacterium]|nr:GIY-YIG nuclease family protein [Candidatus Omnitrophota bacterium]MBU1127459.1 GIY-YIG nuclease family protein [Candidatus Omnitrophota bacterium]MBU1785067.1 GIY-YIG nuclease family protein [Candidatus Omnitrophota bacterium]MBU1851683.1 GIY-YIG nuclease family protein [Candidatus Omnitrophota bacterium]
MDKFYVIPECQDGTYYTGHTNNLERRLRQHNTGKLGARYTRWKKAGALVWTKEYRYSAYAMRTGHRIKQLNRRQKELLVGGMRLGRDIYFSD